MWVLRHVDHICRGSASDPPSTCPCRALAALFHDAVYDPTRADNEAVSADLARSTPRRSSAGRRTGAATVRRLVLATARHTPRRTDEAVLVDADLAILGAEPKDYAAYVQGVRAEYAHVTDEQWRAGRAAVLRRFLDATRGVPHRRCCAANARRGPRPNLAAELASLR